MKIYELTTIGEFHINYNEDALAINEINDDKILIAVMDGCSMGKESHFASTLIAKILRKIAKEISFKEFVERNNKSTKDYLIEVLKSLFNELKEIKNRLMLEIEEVLSTLILGILDHNKKEAEIVIIGDGLICNNGEYIEFEQDDKPDYIGYHLNKSFKDWFKVQNQKLSLKNISDLSISTDGIFTFKKFDAKEYEEIENDKLIDLMLIDNQWEHQDNMLNKKLTAIENQFGLKPTDDLTILRVIID